MTPEQFAYWLRGFLEVTRAGLEEGQKVTLTEKQLDMIDKHLASVFTQTVMTSPTIIYHPDTPRSPNVQPGTGGFSWPTLSLPIVTCGSGGATSQSGLGNGILAESLRNRALNPTQILC